jgi:hypothetical protein
MGLKNLFNKLLGIEVSLSKELSVPISNDTNYNVGLKLNEEQQKKVNKKFQKIAESIIADIESSGFFKSEKFLVLSKKINEITCPGYRYSDPFSYDDCLTLNEKNNLV